MSRTLYLLRHGQTEFNAEGRLQGQSDSALTPLGRRQARAFGRALRSQLETSNSAVVASPLGRVRATVDLMMSAAGLEIEVAFDARLVEIGLGAWEGLTEFDIDAQWPEIRSGRDRYDWLFDAPGGETYDTLEGRAASILEDIANGPADTCIVVSHGMLGRVLRGLYCGLPRSRALRLEAPQDGFFELTDGCCELIKCDLGPEND